MKLNIQLITFLLALCSLTIGCNQEKFNPETPEVKTTNTGIYVKNGVLHFDSISTFLKTQEKLDAMTELQKDEWEKSLDFTSLRTEINHVYNTTETMDSYENYRNFINTNADIVYYNENDSIVLPKISTEYYTSIVNRAGQYVVAGVYYTVTDRTITAQPTLESLPEEARKQYASNTKSTTNPLLAPVTSEYVYTSEKNNNTIKPKDITADLWVRDARYENKDRDRRVFTQVHIYRLSQMVSERYNGQWVMQEYSRPRVELQVWGHKKSWLGWNIYSTTTRFDRLSYSIVLCGKTAAVHSITSGNGKEAKYHAHVIEDEFLNTDKFFNNNGFYRGRIALNDFAQLSYRAVTRGTGNCGATVGGISQCP